jgi:hypothetical protein
MPRFRWERGRSNITALLINVRRVAELVEQTVLSGRVARRELGDSAFEPREDSKKHPSLGSDRITGERSTLLQMKPNAAFLHPFCRIAV